MGKHGKEIEREKPVFEGKAAEKFTERWNAVTKAIKIAAGALGDGKEGNSCGGK